MQLVPTDKHRIGHGGGVLFYEILTDQPYKGR